jgi:hypothetical protein
MTTKEANLSSSFEERIRNLIHGKRSGYKTFGALTGGMIGSGIGGTKGLIDAVKSQNRGEMDELETKEKIKQYIRMMLGPGLKGLAAGGTLGMGGGALLRRRDVGMEMNKIKPKLEKTLKGFTEKQMPYAEKAVYDKLDKIIPKFDMMDHAIAKIKGESTMGGPPPKKI